MPAQPKETLEKILTSLGFPATVEEHKLEEGVLLDVKTDDAGREKEKIKTNRVA